MTKIKVKGNFEELKISIEEDLESNNFLGTVNGVRTDINYFLINMINNLSKLTPNVKIFQGYANKVQEDLNNFFMMQKVDLEKIKIAQSETNDVIHLTLIY
jgi:hypothetical protein